MNSARKLSPQEAAFCRAYVLETDRNGAAAAVKAGYSKGSAKVSASKLLKRQHVRDEIKRLEADALKRSGMVSSILTAANQGADRQESVTPGSIADQIRNEDDANTIAALARAYILAAVKENLDICLGRKKRTMIKFKQTKDDKGQKITVSEEIQIFDPNPSAANAAAQILLAAPEISGAKALDNTEDGANAALHEALKEFDKR